MARSKTPKSEQGPTVLDLIASGAVDVDLHLVRKAAAARARVKSTVSRDLNATWEIGDHAIIMDPGPYFGKYLIGAEIEITEKEETNARHRGTPYDNGQFDEDSWRIHATIVHLPKTHHFAKMAEGSVLYWLDGMTLAPVDTTAVDEAVAEIRSKYGQ